jgi:hypothetical protein
MQARPIIDAEAEDITDYVKRLERIAEQTKAIYLAGHWRCPEMSEDKQEQLWRDLRDTFEDVSYTRDVLGGEKE